MTALSLPSSPTLSPSQKTLLDSRCIVDAAHTHGTSIVEQWHNEAHPGVFRYCDQQPCHAVNFQSRP